MSAEDVEADRHVTQMCTLSSKMAATSSDLYLFGEDLNIFLDFIDDDEEFQSIFDEKVDEVSFHEFFCPVENTTALLCVMNQS